ncbi:MAG: hypothetical protein KGM91_25415 [Burkholderiales bacterium]|nr:hypothetical protein [Burkholderiales bacterium]
MKTLAAALALVALGAHAEGPVYRCPGNPESYTNLLTPQEAKERGCRTIEGTPITVVATPKPRPAAAPGSGPTKVEPAEQRARDADRRRILGDELRRAQEQLAQLQKDYNNGQPERQGNEHNYQRYLDRVAEMKAAIESKQADVAALQRELANLPQ